MSSGYTKKQRFFNFIQKIVFLHIALFFLRNFFYLLEKLVRKDKRLLIYYLTEKFYYDNSRYLFEYSRTKNDFNSILFTPHRELYEELKDNFPGEVVYAKSWKGLKLFLQSKQVIISYGISAAAFNPYYLHEKCKNIVYLGHGTPIKKMGMQTEVWQKYGKKFQLQRYSYMAGCSEVEQIMHAAGFHINMDRVWVSGLPRNDYLMSEKSWDKTLPKRYSYLNNKVFLYAPTWREEGHKTRFFPFEDFSPKQLGRFLKKHDAYLLVRGHKEDIKRNTIEEEFDIFSIPRVIKADQDKFPDISQLLPYVDVLITDYSSVMIDYLLLDRPICFIPYDLEEYQSYKGFFLNYENNTPGAKVFTQKSFQEKLERYISHPQTHSSWRKRVRDMYHSHQDGNSCERIYKKILNEVANR